MQLLLAVLEGKATWRLHKTTAKAGPGKGGYLLFQHELQYNQ
jgi:hypothetical protein